MKTKPRITESELQALLDSEWDRTIGRQPVPAHWQTSGQIAQKWGIAESAAYKRLWKYTRDGSVAARKFRVDNYWRVHFCPYAVLEKLEPHVRPQAQSQGPHSD